MAYSSRTLGASTIKNAQLLKRLHEGLNFSRGPSAQRNDSDWGALVALSFDEARPKI
jgi:hypothetical protein